MTGWRIGMAMGNPDLIAAISKVKENTDSGIFNAISTPGSPRSTVRRMRLTPAIGVYKRRRDRREHVQNDGPRRRCAEGYVLRVDADA